MTRAGSDLRDVGATLVDGVADSPGVDVTATGACPLMGCGVWPRCYGHVGPGPHITETGFRLGNFCVPTPGCGRSRPSVRRVWCRRYR